MSPPKPPWIEFPDIPWGSVGWRMGSGETHWNDWHCWYKELTEAERLQYQINWPEREDWEGFYAFIEKGTKPQWAADFHEKLRAPQALPGASEVEITDYFRVAWLVRNHLKREASAYGVHREQLNAKPDEDVVEFYSEPSGRMWRLGYLAMAATLKRLAKAQKRVQIADGAHCRDHDMRAAIHPHSLHSDAT
jgi:hypothetical protein